MIRNLIKSLSQRAMTSTYASVGNAVLGVPAAEGSHAVPSAGTVLAHRTRWNAGDGVPYA